jgi:hypothetical protein
VRYPRCRTRSPWCAHILADEPNLSVRSIIPDRVDRQQVAGVVDGLLPLLRSEDANLRNGAIEALQQMPMRVAPRVEAMLADADSDVRILPSDVLRPAAPHGAGVAAPCRDHDPHVTSAPEPSMLSPRVGEPSAIPALEALVDRFPNVAFIQFAVDAAVRRIRGR